MTSSDPPFLRAAVKPGTVVLNHAVAAQWRLRRLARTARQAGEVRLQFVDKSLSEAGAVTAATVGTAAARLADAAVGEAIAQPVEIEATVLEALGKFGADHALGKQAAD